VKRWLTVLVVGAAACGAGVEPGVAIDRAGNAHRGASRSMLAW